MSKLANWFEALIPDAGAVFRRFPLAIVLVAAFTFVILAEENFADISNEMMMQLLGGIVLAAYVSVILTLFGEGCGKPVALIIKAVAVLASLVFGYFFRELAFITPAAIGASVLFLGNAPFWRQKRDDVAVWDFTHKLWTAVLFTVAGSIIYVMGIFAITGALKSLFSINIKDVVTDWLLPIGLGFLAPMAWMSMLPRHDEDDGGSLRNPGFISRAVGFLGTWILAPLTLIFAVILVAYGVKIAMTQSVPDGEIAQLVTPFLIIGTLTWLILDPPFIQKKRLARLYAKLWFPLSIPAALLLAYAVLTRIGQYGWTIERYLLVLASVWALGIAVWFIFRGEAKRDIRIIPGFATLLLVLSSIGPWGADAVSSFSQGGRLQSALVANQMLDEQGVLKPVSDIELVDIDASVKAKGALDYLIKHQKGRQILKFVPADEAADIMEQMDTSNSWQSFNTSKRFGLDKVKTPNRYMKNEQLEYNSSSEVISVMGYDVISKNQSYNYYGKDTNYDDTYQLGSFKVLSKGKIIRVENEFGVEVSKLNIVAWLRDQPVNNVDKSIKINSRLILFKDAATKIVVHINYARYSQGGEFASIQYVILAKGVGVDE